MKRILLVTVLSTMSQLSIAHGQNRPSLVPAGWIMASSVDELGKKFVSPDGRSWMTAKSSSARRNALDEDMDHIARGQNETVTYHRSGKSWIAVSGYRSGNIFYRKSNLACNGTRWHHISLSIQFQKKVEWMHRDSNRARRDALRH
jgi:hypothetical protein